MTPKDAQPVAKSMADIASIMAEKGAAARTAHRNGTALPDHVNVNAARIPEMSNEEVVVEASTDDVNDTNSGDDTIVAEVDDNVALDATSDDTVSGGVAETDDDGVDELEVQAEQDDVTQVGNDPLLGNEEPIEFEIDDSDLVEIGEETVSLGNLKKLYKADDNILAAVEEADTSRREASVTFAKAQDDSEKTSQAMQAVVQHVADIVAQPLVTLPNEGLKSTDPARYIAQLELYQQDQQRIQQAQGTLVQALDAHAAQEKELINARKQHELHLLSDSIPALKNPETRTEASQDILDAGAYYGFSPDEINNAIDHRVYRMAHDAQQYRKLMAKSGENIIDLVEDAKTTVKKQTRTLHSRSTTAKNRLTAQAKRQKVLKTKATKTGKPKDVAAFMAAKSR